MSANAPKLAGPDAAILARFPGRCASCGGEIHRGDLIAKRDGEWGHDDCERAATRELHRPLGQSLGCNRDSEAKR